MSIDHHRIRAAYRALGIIAFYLGVVAVCQSSCVASAYAEPAGPASYRVESGHNVALSLSTESSCSRSWSITKYKGALRLDLSQAPDATMSLTLADSNRSGSWGAGDVSRSEGLAYTCEWNGSAQPHPDGGWSVTLTLDVEEGVWAPYACLDVTMDRKKPPRFSMRCDVKRVTLPMRSDAFAPTEGAIQGVIEGVGETMEIVEQLEEDRRRPATPSPAGVEMLWCDPIDEMSPYALRLASGGFSGKRLGIYLSNTMSLKIESGSGSDLIESWSLQTAAPEK